VAAFVSALAAATQATSEAPLLETHEPLPPLAGEATRVTRSARPGDADEEDPIAPPPEPAPVAYDPTSSATLEMLAVTGPEQTTSQQPVLPAARTRVVERVGATAAGTLEPARPTPTLMPAVDAIDEPRVTVRSMTVSPAWDGVATEATRRSAPPRLRWILTGALFGLALALIIALVLR
jgi:hypothetical protein